MPTKEKFVIFDGNALVHRAWHALPPLTTREGMLVNAVYGFTTIFLRVLKELKPKYVAVTFDRREPTFRHQEFKAYKAQRQKQSQEFYDQIPLIKEIVAAFNLPIYEVPGFEADDIIGTVTKIISSEYPELESIIVTGDLDTLQLVDEHTKVYTLKHGLVDTITYDQKAVKERYGLEPQQLIDYKSLRGDPSDNIPGVKGIGEKTAAELIKNFGNLDNLYKELEKDSKKTKALKPSVKELLLHNKKEAYLSKKLVSIVRNVKIIFVIDDCLLGKFAEDKLIALFQQLEFKSLLPKILQLQAVLDLPVAVKNKKTKGGSQDYQLVDTEDKLASLVRALAKEEFVAIDTETSSINPWQSKLVGISLCFKEGEAYFVVADLLTKETKSVIRFKELLVDKNIAKVGHNIKFDLEVLWHNKLQLAPIVFDSMIAAYLLRAGGERNLDLNSLVFQEFGYRMQPIEDLLGTKGKKQKNMLEVPIDKVAWYSGEDADFTFRLKSKLEAELSKNKLDELFDNIEIPLIPVLAQIEQAGFKIDKDYLGKMQKKLAGELVSLEEEIHKLAGKKFNIASPLQLKDILFEVLKISPEGIRRTKTGLSTAASELEKMKDLHPIIKYLLEFRELSKLQSTYVEALPELVNPETGRVHTSFNQTVTVTGRLSSSDPNLQNIPIRGEWGPLLRRAFIADKGNILLSADYSQIELRIVARLAHDTNMMEIFQHGADIHTSTAAYILGVEPDKITRDQRRSAKEVNFGVLYGMGPWGLAERTGISREEARNFINRYFDAFPGVARWIEDTKNEAREYGYVTTLLGRKRRLPEINSGVQQIRAAAERMAVNLPTQGTAADLMKLAMIKIAAKLLETSKDSQMILQVHDELVFEVPEGDVKKVAKMVKQEMENALKLSVPIVVELKQGKNWGEMEVLSH